MAVLGRRNTPFAETRPPAWLILSANGVYIEACHAKASTKPDRNRSTLSRAFPGLPSLNGPVCAAAAAQWRNLHKMNPNLMELAMSYEREPERQPGTIEKALEQALGSGSEVVAPAEGEAALARPTGVMELACTCKCGGEYFKMDAGNLVACGDLDGKECVRNGKVHRLEDCKVRLIERDQKLAFPK